MSKRIAIFLILTCLTTLACRETPHDPNATTAIVIELTGCPNLHKVSDRLYRSAQPKKEGFINLEKTGIKTVVNLRAHHSDEKLLKDTSLEHIRIKTDPWAVKEEHIVAFLKIATDPEKTPVLVHCRHGADRTGAMVAAYRVIVEGWDREKAIKEMTAGPFEFHKIFKNIPKLIKNLNTEEIKKQITRN